jgi:hypothetical protein
MRHAFALALLAACGCAQVPSQPPPTDLRARFEGMQSPDGRERAMNQYWQNRRYSELVATLGQPRRLLNIPGGGNPPGFVAVYGTDPATGCIDAFAMVYGSDPTVRVYHCR